LFTPSLLAEQKNVDSIPSKVGATWFKGGANYIYKRFNDGSDCYLDRDMSSWDWTFTGQLYEWDLKIRQRLWIGYNEEIANVMKNRYIYMSKSDVIFSDGTMYRQDLSCIMKSGLLITLSANSRSQLLIKMAYCYETFGFYDEKLHGGLYMGDDTIEKIHGIDHAHYLDWILSAGFRVKKDECEIGPLLGRQFCSHRFIQTPVGFALCPDNYNKHLYAVKRKQEKGFQYTADQLHSLCMEYGCRQDARFMAFYQALVALDPSKARSFAYYFDFHFNVGLGLEHLRMFGQESSCVGRKLEDGEECSTESSC
jgi:hypothetical protein